MAAARVLDAKGELCPIPVVMTSEAIREIGVGERLEVLSTDPAAAPDFQAWSKMTGHKLVESTVEAGPPPVYRFLFERAK